MGLKRSTLKSETREIYSWALSCLMLICLLQISRGVTSNPSDVAAINNLYIALGSPVLPGWKATGGDPCGEAWQGVLCNGSNIQSITLNGANLGGELGDNLGSFSSITAIDLSNNQIGGSIPSNLPVTMKNFFLSANQFTGTIPDSLSTLTELTDMSLNSNLLTGEMPDAFQSLTKLINLDLSSNNLSGRLPPSMESMSFLTTLHLQNNQLAGTLDVLQDLPLRNLNIENNLFNGPIPSKLLGIPTFKKDGNPFNATIAPVPAPTTPSTTPTPAPPFFGGVPSGRSPPRKTPPGRTTPAKESPPKMPGKKTEGPSAHDESNSEKSKKVISNKRIVWISIAGVFIIIVLALGLLLFMPTCSRRSVEVDKNPNRHDIGAYKGNQETTRDNRFSALPPNHTAKGAKESVMRPKDVDRMGTRGTRTTLKPLDEQHRNVQKMSSLNTQDNHGINMSALDMMPPPPPPPPPPPLLPPNPAEIVIVEPMVPSKLTNPKPSARNLNPTISVRHFTIASLQEYTHSFSPENLIGEGMLGNVYRAELPDGKLLAVKRLDKRAPNQQKDSEFLELVNHMNKIRHVNVVELMGYCAEHGERLLVYNYCSNGSLQDALHLEDDLKEKLSWNTRIRMALEAARALEYLHEVCHPPIIHRNFKSANLLLDDDLSVHVSDCGLAPLIMSSAVNQLSGHLLTAYGYGAPEFETGVYTIQSDVYSFGVVMLELLTGRKSYDRTRNRGEQFLVRWAIPQLHDIDALSRMVDPSLKGRYPAKSLSNFADIISRCVQPEPEFRPQMSEVVQDIQDMIRRESRRSS